MRKAVFFCCLILMSLFCVNGGLVRSDIAGRNIAYLADEQIEILPDGLTAVEYIESTGTQYIDTGIYLRLSDIIEVDCSFSNRNSVFGIYDTAYSGSYIYSTFSFNMTGSGSYTRIRYIGGYLEDIATSYDVRYLFQIGNGKIYMDGVLRQEQAYQDCNSQYTCPLFCRVVSNGTHNDYLKGKIYSFMIYDKDKNLLLKLCPVRFVNDFDTDEGGMYDFVSRRVLLNQGTGSFIIGPDL